MKTLKESLNGLEIKDVHQQRALMGIVPNRPGLIEAEDWYAYAENDDGFMVFFVRGSKASVKRAAKRWQQADLDTTSGPLAKGRVDIGHASSTWVSKLPAKDRKVFDSAIKGMKRESVDSLIEEKELDGDAIVRKYSNSKWEGFNEDDYEVSFNYIGPKTKYMDDEGISFSVDLHNFKYDGHSVAHIHYSETADYTGHVGVKRAKVKMNSINDLPKVFRKAEMLWKKWRKKTEATESTGPFWTKPPADPSKYGKPKKPYYIVKRTGEHIHMKPRDVRQGDIKKGAGDVARAFVDRVNKQGSAWAEIEIKLARDVPPAVNPHGHGFTDTKTVSHYRYKKGDGWEKVTGTKIKGLGEAIEEALGIAPQLDESISRKIQVFAQLFQKIGREWNGIKSQVRREMPDYDLYGANEAIDSASFYVSQLADAMKDNK